MKWGLRDGGEQSNRSDVRASEAAFSAAADRDGDNGILDDDFSATVAGRRGA